MFRLFIDEFGHQDMKGSDDPDQQYLGLTGIIMDEGYASGAFTASLNQIKRDTFGGVSILLCKRRGFVFGDGVPGKGAVPLPWPSDLEATPVSLRNSLQGRHAFRP